MKVSLSGLLNMSALELKAKKKGKYADGYAFMLEELYRNLEELRNDKTKFDEFFNLYS